MTRLVVVESPTKARTIRQFLPREYRVEACMGHVRDLPSNAKEIPAAHKGKKWARLGVDVEGGFKPLYVVPADKTKTVKTLKDALAGADELILATDEDREGESIGWHLTEVLKPKVPVRRMVFHEITKDAILGALDQTREIDTRLVDAQEARRVLDRLVGYTISPLLWKKIAPRLSAGRVQSVALKLVAEREWARLDFMTAGYHDLKATLEKDAQPFDATMTHVGEQRIATGKDFDEATGEMKEGLRDVVVLDAGRAGALAEQLLAGPWEVAEVEEKRSRRSPTAPFITSSLQQEANRKLGLPARRTMQVAQALYERGLITYMRTDSPTLSQEAIDAARRTVTQRYGADYLSPEPRQFTAKVRNAQEAHEAIRPAGTEMRTANEWGLSGPEAGLYDLIWKRTVASQMADARLIQTRAVITAGAAGPERGRFRASGQVVEFAGFFRAYVEGSDDPDAALDDRDQPLPRLARGDRPACRRLDAVAHETKPPARYTDATLVQALERDGVGRPSTYASIIDTIVDRGYVRRAGNQLVPTFTGMATNTLLAGHFKRLVDVSFTAQMEEALDEIAAGKEEAKPYLERFFLGPQGLEARVAEGEKEIDARTVSELRHPKWSNYIARVGRYGPYVEAEIEGEKVRASLPQDLAPADVTEETFRQLLEAGAAEDHVLGIHPEADLPVLVKQGPYGPYVQLGDDAEQKPKRMSLPKGMATDEVDLQTALALLSLPRTLGDHPETGEPIRASIGRFGPYVQQGSTFASLKAEDDVLSVGLDRGLELLANKSRRNEPLKALGAHPVTGKPVEIHRGRYGAYVKHEKTNATIAKDQDPEALTMEQAVALLADRAEKDGAKRPAAKSGTKRAAGAKKPARKKKAVESD